MAGDQIREKIENSLTCGQFLCTCCLVLPESAGFDPSKCSLGLPVYPGPPSDNKWISTELERVFSRETGPG